MSNVQKERTPLVAPLSHFGGADVAVAGGKGANLGELIRSGFAVPQGFVVTTRAYDLLFGEPGFQHELAAALGGLDFQDAGAVAQASGQLRTRIEQAEMPEQLSSEIVAAYGSLESRAVAVRSSATAEDLPGATFAGQQETFLNVIGGPELMHAIRACWASLWSERAISYRAHQGVDQHAARLAVVVQEMVNADAAGVMFTADPVTGSRDELVIDGNPGLGEAVVGGLVTPDHFIVSKRSGRLIAQRPGRREVIVRAAAGGGTVQIASSGETAVSLSLPAHTATDLARLGMQIERHYGAPQDIEWAWTRGVSGPGQTYILQARPMTALPALLKVSAPMRLVLPLLVEMWPARPFPLDMTTFTGAVERAIGSLLVAMIGKSAPNPDDALLEEEGVVVRFQPPQVHPSPAMLARPWLAVWRTRRNDLAHWQDDPSLQQLKQDARLLDERDSHQLSWNENIETIQQALALTPLAMDPRVRYLPKAIVGLGSLWLLLRLAGRAGQFGALISGIETKTTETNAALEALAAQIREDAVLRAVFARRDGGLVRPALERSEAGRLFLQRFEAFLEEYGHREMTLTISQPAWKDDPEGVLTILRVLAEGQAPAVSGQAAWEQARDEILQRTLLGTRPLRGWLLWSLSATRCIFQIREDTHFYATMMQPPIRRAALELGNRLVQAGALNTLEDVFHLRFTELEALGQTWPPSAQEVAETRSLVERRKAKRASLANEPMVDPRLLSLGREPATGADVLLEGTSGSPGIARGPARIVHDLSEFGKLQSGDVLVAPVTNPAWTPLFQRAAAVVVDTGGAASHAAIVAREYGIPAVMGTISGTEKLKDDQWIRVDGSQGRVFKEQEPE